MREYYGSDKKKREESKKKKREEKRLKKLSRKSGASPEAGMDIPLPEFPADKIWALVSMPIDQASGIIHKTLTHLSKEPLYGSILQSILRRRVSEIDFINGEVTVVARSMGTTAPLNRKVVDLVHEVEREGRFFSIAEIKKEFEL